MLSPLLNLGNLIISYYGVSEVRQAAEEGRSRTTAAEASEQAKKAADQARQAAAKAREKLAEVLEKDNLGLLGGKKQTFASKETILKFPRNLGLDNNEGIVNPTPFIRYKPYNYAAGVQKNGLAESAGSIYLAMPSTVTQNTNPNWAQETDALSHFSSIDTTKDLGNQDNWDRAVSAATAGVVKGAAKIVQSVTSALGAPDITKATMRRWGSTFNPFNERFFDGVSYRVYSFEHKFLPESVEDSATVFNTIRRFQYFSLPDYAFNKNFLTYPSLWRIGFFQEDSKRNQFLPILDDCVVTLVGVVFGGGGSLAELKAGEPVEVTLSLQVTETTIPTKSRMLNEEHGHTRTRSAEQARRQLDFGRVTWGGQSSMPAPESTGIYAGPGDR